MQMNQSLSLVFVDSAVEDFQSLIADIKPNTKVILLESNQDGVAQITKVLTGLFNITSIHIVSHGSAGTLQLGNRFVDTKALQTSKIQSLLQQWKAAFSKGVEILLYGCEVAAGSVGKAFVEQLSRLTGVPIAASETKTGCAALGGNWELTYQTHPMASPLPFHNSVLENYHAVLTLERVSIASDGTQSNNSSSFSSLSADGRYIAFESYASNLVSGDTNNSSDIFVRDRQNGITSRVSIASNEDQGNSSSAMPSISADGRYVAFESYASNLVSGDTNGVRDMFVHDRLTGISERVSVASDGTQGNDHSLSLFSSISADGRYVAFQSNANNLVSGDTNGATDTFVHDRQTGATQRISVGSNGTQANGFSSSPSISADGRYIAFSSNADNLVSGDTNNIHDIFVHDQQTGITSRVSIASDGTQGNSNSYTHSISNDGRYVAFYSYASNLVSGDTNGTTDIFVHDRQTNITSRVSVANDGTQANGGSDKPSISADGRYITFHSSASNLVSGDTNSRTDIFVHDRQTGVTSLVSMASDGTQGNGTSFDPSISADGRSIAFYSDASNLVNDDTNDVWDIFVHTLNNSSSQTASIGDKVWNDANLNGIQDAGETGLFGVTVQLYNNSNTLVASTTTDTEGLYSFNDLDAGEYSVKFIEPANYAFTTQNAGVDDTLDSDADVTTGQTAFFTLEAGENDVSWDAGLCFTGGVTERVSIASDGTEGNSYSYAPSISGDGRYVAFYSGASNLVEGDTNNTPDVFIHDRQTGLTNRISVASDGTQGNSYSVSASISADGRYVAFYSVASNLVEGDTNNTPDVFIHDRQTGLTNRISVASDGTQGNSSSVSASISANGRYVAFMSSASNLVEGDTFATPDVFVHDQQTGITKRISLASDGTPANDYSFNKTSISADGRYIGFSSYASNLVEGDTNNTADVFVYDQQTGITKRVSLASDGTEGNSYSASPSFSADGRYVAFESSANNLVEGDTNSIHDIFVHDQQTGMTKRVSLTNNGSQANSFSEVASISANGNFVAFVSDASNLVEGDTNNDWDIFVHTLNNPSSQTASIGDTVWNDANANGIQDAEETGLSDVTVDLYDSSSSTLVASTTTDAEGLYRFNDLEVGEYFVKFVAPNCYAFTTSDIGTDNSLDSDADITTGQTAVFSLVVGENDTSWDAGLYQVKFIGTKGADIFIGNDGNNIMTGLAGNDTLIGYGGNDQLNGGVGSDSLVGGLGNDMYTIDTPGDTVVENADQGIDQVNSSLSYSLGSNVEKLTLTGTGNTTGIGNELNNVIRGNVGNNWLTGNAGDDNLNGLAGDDTLNGGAGNDLLTGGDGYDLIVYNTGLKFKSADIGIDRINGFVSGTDQILLSQTTFTTLTTIESEFATVTSQMAVANSEALIVYNSTNGRLFYNENGAEAGFGSGGQFATLVGLPTINANDFLLVA